MENLFDDFTSKDWADLFRRPLCPCPKCGILTDRFDFCERCGAPLFDPNEDNYEESETDE